MSYCKLTLLGHLGRDPELRTSADGKSTCRFTVATNYYSGGENKTEWFSVVFFGQRAETLAQHFTKGKPIVLDGRLQSRKYQDKEGIERTIYEVIGENWAFVPGTSDGNQANNQPQKHEQQQQQYGQQQTNPSKNSYAQAKGGSAPQQSMSDMDGEIPF